jgi:hypothetical protein
MPGLLSGTQAQQLGDILFGAYDESSLSAVLLSINRLEMNKQVPMGATPQSAMLQIVLNANKEGWVPALLKAIKESRSENLDVLAFFAVYDHLDPARNPHLDDPWTTHLLNGGQFFIGRPEVRRLLKKLNDPRSRKVLIIRSDRRQVGKTHTCELINFVSGSSVYTKVSYIDLDQRLFDLRTLARKLALEWNIEPNQLPVQGEEQETRWAQQLAQYLIENAPQHNNPVRWLFIDGFRERIPSPGIQELIDQLATRIQSTATFRLVLANYNQVPPLTLLSFVDIVTPITQQEIEAVFSELHLSKHKQEPSAEECQQYMAGYEMRLNQYKVSSPEYADSHLLIHRSVADVAEEMQ